MAADGLNFLRLQLVHGQDKHELHLELPPNETGEGLTVSHLAKEVERLTDVPRRNQKLICKGKSLVDQFQSLKSLGMKNNSKVMVIGKKASPQEDQNMVAMAMLEADLAKVEKRLSEVIDELDGIHRGFLPDDLQGAALKKLATQLVSCMEEFTRFLERLDSLSLSSASVDVRNRRKNLVTKIQKQLDQCDGVQSGLKEMQAKEDSG